MSVAYSIRILNSLDTFESGEGNGDFDRVHFYATMEDKEKGRRPVTTLVIHNEYIQAETSSTLSANGWGVQAAAYRRAEEFLRLSGLRDSRV